MTWQVIVGDVRERLGDLPPASVQCVVTSPPYWGLRDYGTEGQIGLEPTPEAYVENIVEVFREVRRVLRDDGTVWLNLGDSYATSNPVGRRDAGEGTTEKFGVTPLDGSFTLNVRRGDSGLKPKDLVGIPWRVAFALQADGWYLRSDIIWAKPNPMPESVTDRPTKAHEYIFMLSKSARYFFDADAVRESYGDNTHGGNIRNGGNKLQHYRANDNPKAALGLRQGEQAHGGRNIRDVWEVLLEHLPEPRSGYERDYQARILAGDPSLRTVWNIATEPFPGAHFATFPKKLVEPCVKAGSAEGDTVLDPFCGSGTTGLVALRLGRSFVGIELNPTYAAMARDRIRDDAPLFNVETEAMA